MLETVKNVDLKAHKEELLKNMRMLRHTVADMLGSNSFLKGIEPGAQNGIIGINGETFPVYITANTLAADGLPEITDDIFDEENYLSLISDDDLLWYALVEHLNHQVELLQKDNADYEKDLITANEEIDNLTCKLAEAIKAQNEYEEALKEANKKCTEYVKENDKLEVDNKRLSERVRTLVCEKCNGEDLPIKFGEQERGTPESKAIMMDLEAGLMQQKIAQLNTRIAQLESARETDQMEIEAAQKANAMLKENIHKLENNNDFLKKEKSIPEPHEVSARIKDLETDNEDLKDENSILFDMLCLLMKRIKELDVTVGLKEDVIKQMTETIPDYIRNEINEGMEKIQSDVEKEFIVQENTSLKEANDELKKEIESLRSEIEKLKRENADFKGVAQARLDEHNQFMKHKEKSRKFYECYKDLVNLMNDLMEIDNENTF